ncbi:hypothetical protein [Maribacter sp. ACAM166]|uniref:hypothetical protein n=1 Tax=Maribacter sp. ACAM166 TaxID=2508996 RepID=UPI0010FF1E28|nr:hypothetical protein [Maribacter sp. ACAM166]TLP74255.1 hypothetical protein ES765_16285 [Maribacter sp. ACAM166]
MDKKTIEYILKNEKETIERRSFINSDGASCNKNSVAVTDTAPINKTSRGIKVSSGRITYQIPVKVESELLHLIQDIYVDKSVTIA